MGIKDEIRQEMQAGFKQIEGAHTASINEMKAELQRQQGIHEKHVDKLFDLHRENTRIIERHVADSRVADQKQAGDIAAALARAESAEEKADHATKAAKAASASSKKLIATISSAIAAGGVALVEAIKHFFVGGGEPPKTH